MCRFFGSCFISFRKRVYLCMKISNPRNSLDFMIFSSNPVPLPDRLLRSFLLASSLFWWWWWPCDRLPADLQWRLPTIRSSRAFLLLLLVYWPFAIQATHIRTCVRLRCIYRQSNVNLLRRKRSKFVENINNVAMYNPIFQYLFN